MEQKPPHRTQTCLAKKRPLLLQSQKYNYRVHKSPANRTSPVTTLNHGHKATTSLRLIFNITFPPTPGLFELNPSYVFRSVHQVAKSDYQLQYVCPSVPPSLRTTVRLFARNNSAPIGRIFIKFDI